jgi:putative signal transducing protein
MDSTDVVEVGRFLNRIDADLAWGALQAAGIPAIVSADDAAGTRPHLWMGGVRLLVPAGDVEEAGEILRAAEQTPVDPADRRFPDKRR